MFKSPNSNPNPDPYRKALGEKMKQLYELEAPIALSGPSAQASTSMGHHSMLEVAHFSIPCAALLVCTSLTVGVQGGTYKFAAPTSRAAREAPVESQESPPRRGSISISTSLQLQPNRVAFLSRNAAALCMRESLADTPLRLIFRPQCNSMMLKVLDPLVVFQGSLLQGAALFPPKCALATLR